MKVTLSSVLRLCGVPRGITSRSPLPRRIDLLPSDAGRKPLPRPGGAPVPGCSAKLVERRSVHDLHHVIAAFMPLELLRALVRLGGQHDEEVLVGDEIVVARLVRKRLRIVGKRLRGEDLESFRCIGRMRGERFSDKREAGCGCERGRTQKDAA